MNVKICPDCGGKVSNALDVCPHCGYVFKKTKVCPDCEADVEIDLNKCPVCGHIFDTEEKDDKNDANKPSSREDNKVQEATDNKEEKVESQKAESNEKEIVDNAKETTETPPKTSKNDNDVSKETSAESSKTVEKKDDEPEKEKEPPIKEVTKKVKIPNQPSNSNKHKKRWIIISSISLVVVGAVTAVLLVFLLPPSNPFQTTFFGKYPQTEVTNTTLINTLNTKAGDTQSWTSYDYYWGDDFGVPKIQNYMRFCDVEEGNEKYRGVFFEQYRPSITTNTEPVRSASEQSKNGYDKNINYWFKYESIEWRVLSSKSGDEFLMANEVLDSQQYFYLGDNNQKRTRSDYQGKQGTDVYDNNYQYSDLRAFLNTTFYNVAFQTPAEQNLILNTIVKNDSSTVPGERFNPYCCEDTTDKILALSYADVKDWSDSVRQIKVTDYAKCQGVAIYNGSPYWGLRSPNYNGSTKVECVRASGPLDTYDTNDSSYGVVPALHIDN